MKDDKNKWYEVTIKGLNVLGEETFYYCYELYCDGPSTATRIAKEKFMADFGAENCYLYSISER